MKLLVDGHQVIVMAQKGLMDSEDPATCPLELCQYLVALAELMCVWVGPGSSPALTTRILSNGANWALLSTLGKALDLGVDHIGSAKNHFGYLHSMVAVLFANLLVVARTNVGPGVGPNANLSALAAAISKQVGLYRFCRALDSASDWAAAYSRHELVSSKNVEGMEFESPSMTADLKFRTFIVKAVGEAQKSLIDLIVRVGDGRRGDSAFVAPSNVYRIGGEGLGGEDMHHCQEMMQRQEQRIVELEQKLRTAMDRIGAGTEGGSGAEKQGGPSCLKQDTNMVAVEASVEERGGEGGTVAMTGAGASNSHGGGNVGYERALGGNGVSMEAEIGASDSQGSWNMGYEHVPVGEREVEGEVPTVVGVSDSHGSGNMRYEQQTLGWMGGGGEMVVSGTRAHDIQGSEDMGREQVLGWSRESEGEDAWWAGRGEEV
ncbi:unnamed protein product [Choristocarpus tenellus]